MVYLMSSGTVPHRPAGTGKVSGTNPWSSVCLPPGQVYIHMYNGSCAVCETGTPA